MSIKAKQTRKRKPGRLTGLAAAFAAAVAITAAAPAFADDFNTAAAKTQTGHSDYITGLQARYGDLPGHLKTAIVDADKIRAEMAARGAARADISTGDKILVDQARAQTGRELSGQISFYIYKSLDKGHPEAFQMRLDDVAGRFDAENEMCVVIPMSPDHTARSANNYIYLKHPAIYGDLTDAEPLTGFTRAEIQHYTDYHEIAHCLDERNERRLVNGDAVRKTEGPYTQHRSDSFADVLAGLLMARDGNRDILSRRADMREATSYLVGRYLGQLGTVGFQDKYLQNAGAIYTVQRPLRMAQKWVDGIAADELAGMSTQALIDKAHEIVDAHALSKNEFNDISGYHMSESYLDGLARMAEGDAYYQARLDNLRQYIADGQDAARRVFGLDADAVLPQPDTTQTITPMGPFTFASDAERAALGTAAGDELTRQLGTHPPTKDNLLAAYIRTADTLRREMDATHDAATSRKLRGMLSTLPDAARQIALQTGAPAYNARKGRTATPRP